jgi:hypothetical protein
MSTKISFNLPDYSLVLKNATTATLDEAGSAIQDEVQKFDGFKNVKENEYKRKVMYYPDKKQVIANADYSAALEYGTKPHVIEPKSAKFLHFKKDGKDVFAKIVHHPGTKPLAIMRNAALKVQKQVGGMFINNFKNNLGKYRIK